MDNLQFSNIESKCSRLITKLDWYARKYKKGYFLKHRWDTGFRGKYNVSDVHIYQNDAASQKYRTDWKEVMILCNMMFKELITIENRNNEWQL